MNCCRIAAIIISYNPDIVILRKLLEIIICQAEKIYVIDNGSNFSDHLFSDVSNKIVFFRIKENLGIAKALNVGIEMALAD